MSKPVTTNNYNMSQLKTDCLKGGIYHDLFSRPRCPRRKNRLRSKSQMAIPQGFKIACQVKMMSHYPSLTDKLLFYNFDHFI